MKQTALGWVLDCLIEKHSNGSFVWNTRADLEALFEQAKEMEKQNIIDAYIECKRQYVIQESCFPPQFVVEEAEQYYNETFKK